MDKPGIVITGVSGRMGQMLVRVVRESDKVRLVGAIERPGSDLELWRRVQEVAPEAWATRILSA